MHEEINVQDLKKKLKERTPNKILYVAEAFRKDFKIDEIYEITKIDRWFLEQIQELVIVENQIKTEDVLNSKQKLQYIKSIGFSDKKIAKILNLKSNDVRAARNKFKIHPIYKKIDTCAGEFDSKTPYMYSTYASNDLSGCESEPTNKKKVIIYPVAFTVDNSETEFELSVEYEEKAKEYGITDYRVSKAPNNHPLFVKAIAELYSQLKS